MADQASNRSRQDQGLGFLLQYENVAWFEEGRVRILDRRVYPSKISFVECRTPGEVASAIRDMVTQSAGPYTAAGMGMALAAWQARGKTPELQKEELEAAALLLSAARPTTKSRMDKITGGALAAAQKALDQGIPDVSPLLFQLAIASLERRYERMSRVGQHLVSLFPQDAVVMTHCFGETIVGTMIRAAQEKGIRLKLYHPETRPYFQGARLTASVSAEMGADATVITDGMAAEVMSRRRVDLFTTAADAITRDGYVVNKVGTLQIAIAARYYEIPYYVTGIPDDMPVSDIVIEERDPALVLEAGGIKNTRPGVKGYYPAFDITPPGLIAGVVTDKGILSPCHLADYRISNEEADYYSG